MQSIAVLHRMSRALYLRRLGFASRLVDVVIRVAFAASVPGRADIRKGVFFHHSGIGVVINGAAVIEEGCEVGVHVVLAGRSPLPGAPHLERDVIVHAGAKIVGPIRIGRGCVVAANAVVLEDMPPMSLVAGMPATAKRSDINVAGYQHLHNSIPTLAAE